MSLCYCRWVLYFSVLGVVVRVEWGGGRFRKIRGIRTEGTRTL